MAERAHAPLSPSGAEQWINCSASIGLMRRTGLTDDESVYARMGTYGHDVAEVMASTLPGVVGGLRQLPEDWHDRARAEFGSEAVDDMGSNARWYHDKIKEILLQHPGSSVFLEHRVDTGVPQCWGTADCIVLTPDGVLYVIDYKYGEGVLVEVVNNPQLKLYGLGALRAFDNGLFAAIESVVLCIAQPRRDRSWTTWETTPAALNAWREEILPSAHVALSQDGREAYSPGSKTCRWCPVSGLCRAQAEVVEETAGDLSDPGLLTNDEIAEKLDKLLLIEKWVRDLKDAAHRRLFEEGTPIPGWKVVRGRSKRTVQDTQETRQRLIEAGYTPKQFTRERLAGVTVLDELVGGKDRLASLLDGLIVIDEGRPQLVPASDRRPAFSSAAQIATDYADVPLPPS